jgi:very-short-patch-repair endonuclease/predicted transcriptional regulator of viral defense system
MTKEAQHIDDTCGRSCVELPIDVEIAAVAESQHGVVGLSQLRELGLSARAVQHRAARGRFHRIHRAVYAVGHSKLTGRGHWMGAVLACGPNAVLSHRSAAGLWGLRPDNRRKSDVSLPSPSARPKQAIEVHRSVTLTAEDVTIVDGIPCTTVARTLVDLGDVVPRRAVERAVEQADVLQLFDLRDVERAIERAGPRRGTGLLLSVLADLEGHTLTDTDLEEAFLSLCRDAALPTPEVNAWMTLPDGTPAKIDFLWRAERLAVETDGGPFHRTRQSRERDARRDQLLRLMTFEPVRFTGRQVAREPGWVKRCLSELIARRHPLASGADDHGSRRAGAQAA